eukprot:9469633-Alexandrium_andersonii.AAC.1
MFGAFAELVRRWGGRPGAAGLCAWDFPGVGSIAIDLQESGRADLDKALHVLRTAWRCCHAQLWLDKRT